MSEEETETGSAGIVCPECKSPDNAVIDSRASSNVIRRRRRCLACQHRFTTYEAVADPEAPDQVNEQLDKVTKEVGKLMVMLKRRVGRE